MKRFLLVMLICALAVPAVFAQFTNGNIVVVRIGDGSAALSSTASAVFLDEYTPAGVKVQSVAMPTTLSGNNARFVNSGSATSEGTLTRSADNRFLVLGGYDADPGTASIASTNGSATNRVVALVNYLGVIDVTTRLSDAYSANNLRGACSADGTGVWTAGTASTGGSVRYAPVGSTTSTQLSTTLTNIRVVNIFNGQLYCSSASGTFLGVSTVGTGIPTTSGQTITELPGLPTTGTHSPYDFSINAAGTVMYMADDGTATNGGGIQKWTYSAGTWTLAYTLGTSGIRHITVDWSGTNPVIYGVDVSALSNIVVVTDSGSGSALTTIATSATNTVFRGIAFAPTASSSALSAPVAAPAINITTTGFTANWNTQAAATDYWIDVSTTSDFLNLLTGYSNLEAGNVTSVNVTSLTPNTTYYYRVRASSGSVTTANSNTVTVKTALLSNPTATAATSITSSGFTANWSALSGATDYWLDLSTAADFSTFVSGYNNKPMSNLLTYSVTGLNPSTTYYYRVRGSNINGLSGNSNSITVVTSALAGPGAPFATSPTNISDVGFTAKWNASANATDYWIDISTAADFSTFVTNYNNKEAGNVTSLNVTALTSGTTYYYRVRASNAGGTSLSSNSINVVTLPSAPVAKAATGINNTGFTANWNASVGATDYWIDVSTVSDFSTFVSVYNNKEVGNFTSIVLTGLTKGTTYYYRVCATNINGTSAYSATITVSSITGVNDYLTSLPGDYELYQNYPNPFNPSTRISFNLMKSEMVSLKVFNIIGQELVTLVNRELSAGMHEFNFDASSLNSGVYIYKISTPSFNSMKKMILMK